MASLDNRRTPPSIQFRSRETRESVAIALKNCKDLKAGKEIHSQAISSGLLPNTYISNKLIHMYIECRSISNARRVFDTLLYPDGVSWTLLVVGYAQNGDHEQALELFNRVKCARNARIYVAAFSSCSHLAYKQRLAGNVNGCKRWLQTGREMHSQALTDGCVNSFVENTLVDMYAKGGCMREARKVFDNMSQRDTISWNALLQGYVENGEGEDALEAFESMQCLSNARTYVAVLMACAGLKWLERGKSIHSYVVMKDYYSVYVQGVLVDMYAKCGCMVLSRVVFDNMVLPDVVVWTALMQGYVENGESKEAVKLFEVMEKGRACVPNARTYVVALSACADMEGNERVSKGESIHSCAVRRGCSNVIVESALLSLYGRSGDMSGARDVFGRMRHRDTVAWNALVMGYVENGEYHIALQMVSRMDVEKNPLTYVAALMACGNLMAIESGKALHVEVRERGFEEDVRVANSLVDFYGRCGCMVDARGVFACIGRKTTVSWTALMCGYSLQGDTHSVFEVYGMMREQGVAPNGVTFVCLLNACNHAGLTERGKEYFSSMYTGYGIFPTATHYVCMVDLLGRANCLHEAMGIIKCMPIEPDAVAWRSILGASKKWNDYVLASAAYEALLRLNDRAASTYELMANTKCV